MSVVPALSAGEGRVSTWRAAFAGACGNSISDCIEDMCPAASAEPGEALGYTDATGGSQQLLYRPPGMPADVQSLAYAPSFPCKACGLTMSALSARAIGAAQH